MPKILLATLTIFTSTIVLAQKAPTSDWISLSQIASEDHFGDSKPKLYNKVFYKLPFQRTGDIVRVVTLIDNDHGNYSKQEFSEITNTDYDCKNKMVRSVSMVTYTGHMGNGAAFKTTNYKNDFIPITTNYSKKEFEIACTNPKTK